MLHYYCMAVVLVLATVSFPKANSREDKSTLPEFPIAQSPLAKHVLGSSLPTGMSLSLIGIIAGFLLCLTSVTAQSSSSSSSSSSSNNDNGFNVLRYQGANSPYYQPGFPQPLDEAPPQGCNVTRATYLIRHTAITGQSFEYMAYIMPLVEKLGNATVNWSATRDLQFLHNWTSPISEGNLEMPTQSGLQTAMELGMNFSRIYSNLRAPQVVWAASAMRTTQTAKVFAEGYTNGANTTTVNSIYEGVEAGANTLAPSDSCNGKAT